MIPKFFQANNKIFAHTYSIIARDPKTGEMVSGDIEMESK